GVLEVLWLHNEYHNKYRDMQDKVNHVLFSNMRDVEDSLIFSRLAAGPLKMSKDNEQLTVNIVMDHKDSVMASDCTWDRRMANADINVKMRHPMRGLLLQRLRIDSTGTDSIAPNMSAMVMHHIRSSDSTGEFAGYDIITWVGPDTVIKGLMSQPQMDVLAGKKMALNNKHYKAEIIQDLLPHMSFALFLWIMVGAAFYYIWKNLRRQIQLNALRDEFVSNITHELKTPITTVGVALESLNMSDELHTPQSRRYLDICQSELKRLSMLVERILHNRAPQIHYEKLDVRQVLDDVMHHMKVQFDNRHATIEVKEEGNGFVINGDKSHLSGVLYNLLENALKYSAGDPVIRIHLARENGSIRLDVEDHGIGIAPDYHDKIFEKLFRVPQQNRHDV
ncbi:MAG TPA: HAMP domain-containing sensor histidine kinase, partial [Saprospiraceae bacterium]|nr:HAMP domain-containing sensor histidine kinase [Saprospiraceae bacterium]